MKRRDFLQKSIPAATLLPALINGYSVKAFAADSSKIAIFTDSGEIDFTPHVVELEPDEWSAFFDESNSWSTIFTIAFTSFPYLLLESFATDLNDKPAFEKQELLYIHTNIEILVFIRMME